MTARWRAAWRSATIEDSCHNLPSHDTVKHCIQ